MLRSKARYFAEGEHSTKYFFDLERSNARSKTMTAVKDKNDNLTHDTKRILNIQADYFQRLYTLDQEPNCKLKDSPPIKLLPEQKSELEKNLDIDEVKNVIKSMAKGKSPGNSDLQADFYVVFWNGIKDMLFDAYQEAVKDGRMSYLQRQGIITLIPKKNRDLLYVKNWRPIILLNTDYKILAQSLRIQIKNSAQYNYPQKSIRLPKRKTYN